jgi:hypothetical protein
MRSQAMAEIKLRKKGTMDKYLNILLQEAKGLNIYIVLAPRNPVALEIFPPEEVLFKNVYDVVNKQNNSNIKIINCFRSFTKDDFLDLVHLNINGAKHITELIKNSI